MFAMRKNIDRCYERIQDSISEKKEFILIDLSNKRRQSKIKREIYLIKNFMKSETKKQTNLNCMIRMFNGIPCNTAMNLLG